MSKSRTRNTSTSAAFVVVNIGELKAAHASGGGTVRADVLHPGKHDAKHPTMGKGSRSRSWLMEDDGTYEMVCYGGHLEMEHAGRVVWKGKATKDGFETTSTSLPDRKCATLLSLALVGEKVKYGAHSGPSRAPASKPAAKTSAAKTTAANTPKQTAAKKTTAKKTAAKKTAAKKTAAKKTAANAPKKTALIDRNLARVLGMGADEEEARENAEMLGEIAEGARPEGNGVEYVPATPGAMAAWARGVTMPARIADAKAGKGLLAWENDEFVLKGAKQTAPKKSAAKKTAPKKTAPKKTAAAESKGVAGVATYSVTAQEGETVVRKDVRIHHPAGVTHKRIQGILDRLPPGKSRLSTVIKQLAKHGAAFVPWDDGRPGDSGAYETAAKKAPAKKAPPSPASGSRPSTRGKGSDAAPPTSRSTGIVDDAQFLDELHAELKKAGAENLFETAKAIWHAGGRQKALEHMAGTKGRSLVKAFLDWMDKHEQDAQAMLAARAS